MNVNSIFQNLLGLAPRVTLNGSWLQLRGRTESQRQSEEIKKYRWPAEDYWIVGRELLIFKSVDLDSVPSAHRAQVLAQNVIRLSPFHSTGHYAREKEGMAEVWMWDESLRLETLGAIGGGDSQVLSKLKRLKVIPETLLFVQGTNGSAS